MTRKRRRPRHSSVSRVNERAFHRWLAATLPAGRTGPLPLGDDSAALRPPSGRVAVLSTDALVEGFHFVARSPADAIGRAAAAVSLSDAAAKGAAPAGILLDLLVPSRTPERWLRSVVLGAEEAAAQFGAHVIGGDTKPSPVRTVVSTVVAWADPRHLAPRSGARPGDLLIQTGTVGRGGLAWRRYLGSGGRPSPATLRSMIDVKPRVREGRYLAHFAHAMIDTSDGLADACHLLSELSGVRLLLEESRIPWARGLERVSLARESRRRTTAFYGGDYELLAAIPKSAWSRVRRTPGVGVTVVGRVERGRGAMLLTRGGSVELPPAGWQPFGAPVRRRKAPPGENV